jgi:hypothetical protein
MSHLTYKMLNLYFSKQYNVGLPIESSMSGRPFNPSILMGWADLFNPQK